MEMKYILPEYIVYNSYAGHTERYAKMFAEATKLPIMKYKEAMKKLPKGSKIIYFGWIQTNIIQGYKEAKKKFDICAVVSVGMFGRGTGVAALRKVSGIKKEIPLFPLKGGINMRKLGPVYKIMMALMKPGVVNDLKHRKEPTPLEKDMLYTIQHGGDFVKPENLEVVLRWFETGEYEEQDYFDDFSESYTSMDAFIEEQEAISAARKAKKAAGKVRKAKLHADADSAEAEATGDAEPETANAENSDAKEAEDIKD